MHTELEETLVRELNDVAGGVHVPPMPSIVPVDAAPDGHRRWQPLLVAASVVLVVGLVALLLGRGDDGVPQPAPSPTVTSPTQASPPDDAIPTTPPTVAFLVGTRLVAGGETVPGDDWSIVETRGKVWLALREDGSWWTGAPGVEARRIDAELDQPPAISPDGSYVAFLDLSTGTARLTGFGTQAAGEGFGYAPIELPASEDGVALRVAAVTDDGDVIVQGTRTRLLWRALFQDRRTVVDLTRTAPGQVILQATAAGLVVVDGANGATDATGTEPYLADLSSEGLLTRTALLPTYDDLVVNPGGTWLVRSPAGTLGGEVLGVTSLRAQPIEGDEVVLQAPSGSVFVTGGWSWEDDTTLLTTLAPATGEGPGPRLGRCDVRLGTCLVLDNDSR